MNRGASWFDSVPVLRYCLSSFRPLRNFRSLERDSFQRVEFHFFLSVSILPPSPPILFLRISSSFEREVKKRKKKEKESEVVKGNLVSAKMRKTKDR